VILNGHEYVACQAGKAGITFTKEGNCFTTISDAAGLAKIADTLSEPRAIGRLRTSSLSSRSGEQPKTAELGNCVDVGLLGCWREVANRHVVESSVDTARSSEPSQDLLSDDWVGTTTILSDRSRLTPSSLPSRASGFVQWMITFTGMIEGSARSRVVGTVDRALQERGIAQKPG
jgi:hypothetical protein